MNKLKLLSTNHSRQRLYFLLSLTLLVLSLNPVTTSAEEGELADGYEMVWNNDMNITVWHDPDSTATPFLNLEFDEIPTERQLINFEHEIESNAWRDVKVEWDYERAMIAITLMLYWSTDSKAISFEDYREMNKNQIPIIDGPGIALSQRDDADDEDEDPIVDVLPDERETEGEVDRSATDIAGSQDSQYDNDTDIDTTLSVIIDVTDYNHSVADWIEVELLRMDNGANASIDVLYAYPNGTLASSYTNVFTTDYYFSATDWFGQLPMPSATADAIGNKATYVAKLNFTDIELESFELYDWDSNYTDSRTLGDDYEFNSDVDVDTGLTPSGLFSSLSSKISNSIKKIPVSKVKSTIAQSGVGFKSIKDSALRAASVATGIDVGKIADHRVNAALDKFKIPKKLTCDIRDSMKSAWDKGEENALAMAREGRKHLKSMTVSVGVRAQKFGEKATQARELSSSVLSSIAKNNPISKAVSAIGSNGKSLFDDVKNSLGQLPDLGSSLFSKLNPANFLSGAGNLVRNIIIAVIIILVVIVAIRLLM